MSYLHEPNNHPALTKEYAKEFPRVELKTEEDIAQYFEWKYQQSIFDDPDAKNLEYSEDYVTWLEELAFKQLTNEN